MANTITPQQAYQAAQSRMTDLTTQRQAFSTWQLNHTLDLESRSRQLAAEQYQYAKDQSDLNREIGIISGGGMAVIKAFTSGMGGMGGGGGGGGNISGVDSKTPVIQPQGQQQYGSTQMFSSTQNNAPFQNPFAAGNSQFAPKAYDSTGISNSTMNSDFNPFYQDLQKKAGR